MEISLTAPILFELLVYSAAFGFALHLSMISYHWYRYVDRSALAHRVIFSYLTIGLISLGTLALAVFPL